MSVAMSTGFGRFAAYKDILLAKGPKYNKCSQVETNLLHKFDRELMTNVAAKTTLQNVRYDTREKYLYQIRRYIRHCANRGLDNFFVTKELTMELIRQEGELRGCISSNTIKSIKSPLNKLYAMNCIVYGDLQEPDPLGDLVEEILVSNGSVKVVDGVKKLYSYQEQTLTQQFEEKILNSKKTKHVLQGLADSTLKAYCVDIKRFIRFCGRRKLDSFCLNSQILHDFLTWEYETSCNFLNKFKSLRRSLLKMHQLCELAYGSQVPELELLNTLHNFMEQTTLKKENSLKRKFSLVDLGLDLLPNSSIFDDLSSTSKKLYYLEAKKYISFCGRQGLDAYNLLGNLVCKYFESEVFPKYPEILSRKLNEILDRICKLHELSETYPNPIPEIDKIKALILQHTEKPPLEKCDKEHNIHLPQFVMKGNITTVTELIDAWSIVEEKQQKWDVHWIKDDIVLQRYTQRKCILCLIEDLIAENALYSIELLAKVFDAYMHREKLTLEMLANRVSEYPTHSKRQLIRFINRQNITV